MLAVYQEGFEHPELGGQMKIHRVARREPREVSIVLRKLT
jgi:hypothetical protein